MQDLLTKSQIIANIWPILSAIAVLIFWSGWLTAKLDQHGRAVAKIFDKIDAQTEAINHKIDENMKTTNDRIDKLLFSQKGVQS